MKDTCLYFNGKIFTSNSSKTYANAMVVEDGKLKWVGDIEDLDYKVDKKVDLNGKRVLPGLVDSHMHPLILSEFEVQIASLPPNVYSIKDIVQKVSEKRKLQGKDKWIQGWGFDEGKLEEKRTPNRWDLDKGASDVPVVITRTCVHIISVNSKALEIAGIDKYTPNPPGGEIDRDENGEPTGILRENAKALVLRHLPQQTTDYSADLLCNLSNKLLSHGITTVAEAWANLKPTDYYDIYIRAREKGYKQRTGIYYDWEDLKEKQILPRGSKNHNDPIFIGGIKVIGDGSVSGQTAWVSEPYLGDGKTYGFPVTQREDLIKAGEFAKKNNLQLVVHAMGDKTIDLVVDTFYKDANWISDAPSVKIEHAAMPTDRAIKKAVDSGISFNIQPIFLYAEIESYLKNLGAERTKETYPVKKVLDAGVKVAFSSDAPATAWYDPSNPFVGLKSAVTRRAYDGTDLGEDQRIDITTAIKLYTKMGAELMGVSNIGELSPGYYADFIVLDKDILEVQPEEIDQIVVDETYINGELVYKRF
ncbi:amidohydrolase [Tissierella creatinophila]|uniref:N-substituted formamide deformylase n=1 Tax=Tissierella creatinophila DSM 6911 TaxID=1123403 RepID=A0A1U7M2I1_TISCR|nr:amidohydrolase [Tissierella creatinophila]OLS01460.1 N-substituted formamide deformylase precursor [Tissierella creatinophila DSM 6911]